MTEPVMQWETIDLPAAILPVEESLGRFGLPDTHAETVRVLVGILVGVQATAQKTGEGHSSLLRRLGYAFFALGGGDQTLGHRYMQVGHAAARDTYGFDISRLSSEWGGIGRWLP
jgi:hypothetical protein